MDEMAVPLTDLAGMGRRRVGQRAVIAFNFHGERKIAPLSSGSRSVLRVVNGMRQRPPSPAACGDPDLAAMSRGIPARPGANGQPISPPSSAGPRVYAHAT